jgi:carbon storage regulator
VLVLSRRPYESFRIGHDVVITVLEVSGDKVRIGIDAPSHVQVHRQEVYDEVEQANADAAAASPSATTDLARAVRGAAKGRTSAPTPPDPAGVDVVADDDGPANP